MVATIVVSPHPTNKKYALAKIEGGKLQKGWSEYCAMGAFDRDHTARRFARADLQKVLAKVAGLPVVVAPELVEAVADDRATLLAQVEACEARVAAAEAASGRELYGFQRDGVRWLASRRAALLADEMGTGKTAQSLLAAGDRVVVVCPASLRLNWRREAGIWRPDLRVTLIDGLGAFRWPAAGEIVVLGYEGLPATSSELDDLAVEAKALAPAKAIVLAAGDRAGGCPEGVTLIADEGHALKGSVRKTARVERWRAVAKSVREKGGSVWVLTATPLLNRPSEIWNVAMAADVAIEAFGSFRAFKAMAGGSDGRFGIVWSPHLADHKALARCLQPVMLRRMKRDVLAHLPPKQRQVVEVSLQLKASEQKALAAAEGLLDEGIESWELDPAFPSFAKLSRALAILGEKKAEAAEDLIASYEAAEEPVVVFTAHQGTVDELLKRPGWVGFHGGTPEQDRQSAVEAFQAGRAVGIALTIAAGGVGITLTRARTAIFLERSWTPALDAQAEDRIHRIGQEAEHVTYVTVLADHPIDRRISALQDRKRCFGEGVDQAARTKDEVAYVPPPALFLTGTEDYASWLAAFELEQAEAEKARAEWEAHRGEREAEAKRERAQKRLEERRARARIEQEEEPTRRVAETERERWVVDALESLRSMDADHARFDNGMGFSKSTSGTGHRLAWTADLGWTAAQWAAAFEIARFHRRQVGEGPEDKAEK